jgi:lipopolysaccharide transport system permease protein
MRGLFNALWRYRGFILSSIINEFKIRFARSRLGGFWMILQPLSQVIIYAMILSTVMAAKLPNMNNQYAYALYLMSGTLAWTLFNEIVTRCLVLFIEQANLMKKMQFPRITLPTIVVGSALFNNVLLLMAILLIFSLLGHYPTVALLWLPLLTLAMVAFAVGVGLTLGVFNVFIRDLTHIVPILMQLFFWATPIVYPLSIIPEKFQYLLRYNPLYPLVQGYQDLILYGRTPEIMQIGTIALFSCGLLGLSLFVFRRASPEMVDVL